MSEPVTAGLDPIAYMRLPKLDVGTALGLANILRHRVPEGSPPAVRTAASAIEHAIAELATQWRQQFLPSPRIDTRPLARRLCAAWKAIRDRLASYAAYPDGSAERTRADDILESVLRDGLAFLLLPAARQHAHSELRIATIDERGIAEDLERLVGAGFLAILRAAHRAYGDALGISKAVPLRPAPVLVAPQLRALTDAISAYTLQRSRSRVGIRSNSVPSRSRSRRSTSCERRSAAASSWTIPLRTHRRARTLRRCHICDAPGRTESRRPTHPREDPAQPR